ncbi:MAG: DUF2807 domain-containing protein [Bacteroides sp.]|nr:DUF2807 domain-containing protein [Prevotella sp.]MCM1408912.1 DUF2807 domain-containing protein [Treponema brennaborense]MCM1470839.1 DUF2807 domain-containing protein [Bacteroides sp.]
MKIIKLCMCLCALVLCRMEIHAAVLRGSGIAETRVFDISPCNEIRFEGNMNARIVYGNAYRVTAVLDVNLSDALEVVSEKGVLRIGFQKNANIFRSSTCNVTVTLPAVSKIHVSGAVNAQMTGFSQNINELSVVLSGDSVFSAAVYAAYIRADISGSSVFDLSGRAEKCVAALCDTSCMNAHQCSTAFADISCSGASAAEIRVSSTLIACASGSSSVSYFGSPDVTSRVSGAAKVNAAETFLSYPYR